MKQNSLNIPSKRSIWLTIILLLIGYNILFFYTYFHKKEEQNYDWQQSQTLDSIEPVYVLAVSLDYLKLKTPVEFPASAKYTYRLNIDKTDYYFRFEYRTKNNDIFSFYDVHWLKGMPEKTEAKGKLYSLNVPQIKRQGESFVTLGDELLCRGYAENLRGNLAHKLHANFVGNQRDVYNYAHQAFVQNPSADILNSLDKFQADNYILFFKWHQKKETWDNFEKNINLIAKKLNNKNIKRVFWIIIPYSGDKKKDSIYRKINEMIQGFSSDKIMVIDSNKLLPATDNYDVDNVLRKKVYDKLSNEIIKQFDAKN